MSRDSLDLPLPIVGVPLAQLDPTTKSSSGEPHLSAGAPTTPHNHTHNTSHNPPSPRLRVEPLGSARPGAGCSDRAELTLCNASDLALSTNDAEGRWLLPSPNNRIFVEDNVNGIIPLPLETTLSPLLALSKSYRCPTRPKLQRSRTWPHSGPALSRSPPSPSSSPSASCDQDIDTDYLGEALSSHRSEAGSEYDRFYRAPHRLLRGESTTTISEEDSVADYGCDIHSWIANVNATEVTSTLAEQSIYESTLFEGLGVSETIPLRRLSSYSAASTYETSHDPHGRPLAQGSTSTASSPPYAPEASRPSWRPSQSFNDHFSTPNHVQDTPPAPNSTSTSAHLVGPRPSDAGKMVESDRRSKRAPSRIVNRRDYSHSSCDKAPLDQVAGFLGTFARNVQVRALLTIDAHGQYVMLKGGQGGRTARKSAPLPSERRGKWDHSVDGVPGGVGTSAVTELMSPPTKRDNPKCSQKTSTASLATLDHTLINSPGTPPSTAVTSSTSSSSLKKLRTSGTPAKAIGSRPKSVFGGVPISEESYRMSALYAKELGKRRQQEQVVAAEARQFP